VGLLNQKPNVQGSILCKDRFFSVPPFRDTFFNISAIDDVYSGRIDTIQVQIKMLTIWLLHKVYCRLLTAFVCTLQVVEDDGVGIW